VPTGASADSRCNAGTVTFSASVPGGPTIDWYDAPTGGSTVTGGYDVSSFSPSINASTTYYAQARNTTTGCVSATRTAVTGTINTVPDTPTMGGGGSQCGGTRNITATPGGNGGTGIRWTDGSSTVSPRTVNASDTYYAVTTTDAGCESSPAPVTITINTVPGVPTMSGGGTQCGGTKSITATAGTNGNGIRWDNGTTAASRSVGTGTYYALTTSAAGCESGTASVAVTINQQGGNGQSASPCGCVAGTTNCSNTCRTTRTYTTDDGTCTGTCGKRYQQQRNQCDIVTNSTYSIVDDATCTTGCQAVYSSSCTNGESKATYSNTSGPMTTSLCDENCKGTANNRGYKYYGYWLSVESYGNECHCEFCTHW
jgi:hypothetical protein